MYTLCRGLMPDRLMSGGITIFGYLQRGASSCQHGLHSAAPLPSDSRSNSRSTGCTVLGVSQCRVTAPTMMVAAGKPSRRTARTTRKMPPRLRRSRKNPHRPHLTARRHDQATTVVEPETSPATDATAVQMVVTAATSPTAAAPNRSAPLMKGTCRRGASTAAMKSSGAQCARLPAMPPTCLQLQDAPVSMPAQPQRSPCTTPPASTANCHVSHTTHAAVLRWPPAGWQRSQRGPAYGTW
mmetsp:Transcript_9918/g.25297  ORF Transcript_9918/g.25297 Transcript_9918/m.25297 type:complete len:240 (+) Transcript_9918:345-1064(+)